MSRRIISCHISSVYFSLLFQQNTTNSLLVEPSSSKPTWYTISLHTIWYSVTSCHVPTNKPTVAWNNSQASMGVMTDPTPPWPESSWWSCRNAAGSSADRKNRRLDKHLVGASLRILLETKRMNVVAWGGGAILNQGSVFYERKDVHQASLGEGFAKIWGCFLSANMGFLGL